MTDNRSRRISVAIVLEATLGGTRKYCYDLLTGLDRSVCDITFVYSTHRADPQFHRDLEHYAGLGGIGLHQIPMIREIHPWHDLTAFLRLWWLFLRRRFDIVHLHSSKAGFLGRIAAALAFQRTKVVYHPHMMAFNIRPWYLYLERFAALFTDLVITDTRSERDLLIEKQIIAPERIQVIDSGIDIHGITLKESVNKKGTTPVIGAVARLSYPKDPLTFVAAAKLLKEQGVTCRFVWVGDGELMDAAKDTVRRLDLEGTVEFVGWQYNPLDWIATFDIFVHSSGYESFGYVIAEAMALSKPVLGSRVTGVKDLIDDGVNGYLFDHADARQLADRVRELIEDPARALSMGSRSRERVEQYFTQERMLQDIQSMYRTLAKGTTG